MTLFTIRENRSYLLRKAVILLISLQVLIISYHQEIKAQEIIDPEIAEIERQLNGINIKIIPIDAELSKLNENLNTATSEINSLKQELREPKSGLGRITGWLSDSGKRGKLDRLLTESQDMADKIEELQKRREPLAKEYVTLADRLIDKAGLRITALLKVARDATQRNDIATRDRTSKQISALWQLATRITTARNKYAPGFPGQEKSKPFLPSESSDPIELRQSAAILKDAAITARTNAAILKKQMKELQSAKLLRERMLETWKEIQRSNEERDSTGIQSGTAIIPWGFSESDIKREINEIKVKIDKLSVQIREYETSAESFDNQSKNLEQRASQIEAKLKGKS